MGRGTAKGGTLSIQLKHGKEALGGGEKAANLKNLIAV